MKVVITDAARSDLAQIGDFIAIDNPVRAVSFLNELRQRCDELASAPKAFPLVPRYRRLGIRRRVHQAYLIFYRIAEDRIEVLHVTQGRRDLDRLLFPEEP